MSAAKRARTAPAVKWVPGAKHDGGPGLALAWCTPFGVEHPDDLPDAELRKFVDLDHTEQLDFDSTNDYAVRIPVQRVLKDLRGGGSDGRSDYIKFLAAQARHACEAHYIFEGHLAEFKHVLRAIDHIVYDGFTSPCKLDVGTQIQEFLGPNGKILTVTKLEPPGPLRFLAPNAGADYAAGPLEVGDLTATGTWSSADGGETWTTTSKRLVAVWATDGKTESKVSSFFIGSPPGLHVL